MNKKPMIMVVEDDTLVRRLLTNQLGHLGYSTTAFKDGESALTSIQSGDDYGCLITDIVLPGQLSGPELANAARASCMEIPVLFVTGYPIFALKPLGLGEVDPNCVLTKPFKLAELNSMIGKAFEPRDLNERV